MLEPNVLSVLRQAADEVFGGLPVLAAYAFGSRVAGVPRPDSDLDIGYYLDDYRHGARCRSAKRCGRHRGCPRQWV